MKPYQTITVAKHKKTLVIRVLERRIFLKIADTFRDELVRAIDSPPERLIVDLSEVNVMNSSGLGVLILARDTVEKNNGRLLLCGLNAVMTEIFARMHLDAYFTIVGDLASARKMMGSE